MARPKISVTPSASKRRRKAAAPEIQLPPITDWRTTDQDEVNRRILRASEEQPSVRVLAPEHPVFGDFEVASRSGMTYRVEIRSVAGRQALAGEQRPKRCSDHHKF